VIGRERKKLRDKREGETQKEKREAHAVIYVRATPTKGKGGGEQQSELELALKGEHQKGESNGGAARLAIVVNFESLHEDERNTVI